MNNPFRYITDYNDRKSAATAGAQAASSGRPEDPERFLTTRGLGIPDRLRADPERAPTELIVAEQRASTLRITYTQLGREVAKLPNKATKLCIVGALWLGECFAVTYAFIEQLGLSPIVGVASGALYTAGTFAITKNLYVNLQKPSHERAWYTPLLAGIFFIGAGSLIALRLTSQASNDISPETNIAAALIFAFVTFLPGWLAAKHELDLESINNTQAEYDGVCIEYHEETLRIAGLRQGIDATSTGDLALLDKRDQAKAIYRDAYEKHTPPTSLTT